MMIWWGRGGWGQDSEDNRYPSIGCAISCLLTKYYRQSLSQTLSEWNYHDKSLMKVLKLSCLEKPLQRLRFCQSWAGSMSFWLWGHLCSPTAQNTTSLRGDPAEGWLLGPSFITSSWTSGEPPVRINPLGQASEFLLPRNRLKGKPTLLATVVFLPYYTVSLNLAFITLLFGDKKS